MAALEALAARQLGLLTLEQLLGSGLSARMIGTRVERGELIAVRRRVYRLAGARPTWEQCLLAAILAAPVGAVASHLAAARVWRMRGIDADLLEVSYLRRLQLDGVWTHRTRTLIPADVTQRGAIPVTTAARTLVDLSSVVPATILGRALDESVRADQTTLVAVDRCARRLRTAHRTRDLSVIRELIAERGDGPELGDSPLETKILAWIREAGLPDPETQYRVRLGGKQRRLDAAYPDLRIAMEFNGWSEHGKRSALEPDLTRRNDIEVDGWLLLEFAHRHTRSEVVGTVRAARAAQATRLRRPA